MGLTMEKEEVRQTDACVHGQMLALVTYPGARQGDTPKRCFFHPRYMVTPGAFAPVAAQAFPDAGCLPAATAGMTSDEFGRAYGSVGVMTLNVPRAELRSNNHYPASEPHVYNSVVNPGWFRSKPGRSAVEFVPLASHPLSQQLMQVLEVQEPVDAARPLTASVHLGPGQVPPQTRLVCVAQGAPGARRLVGPFECAQAADGSLALSAIEKFDRHVAAIDEASLAFVAELEVTPAEEYEGAPRVAFVDAEEFRARFDACPQTHDWVGDDELMDAMGRISRHVAEPLTRKQAQALRAELGRSSAEDAQLHLTPARRARMLGLLDAYDGWTSLPQDVRARALEAATPEQLASYVLTDEHFKGFYEKAIENSQVRERLEQAKARYADEARAAAEQADEARAETERVCAELASYQEQLEEKRRQLEEDMAGKIAAARAEQEALTAEVSGLEARRDELVRDCDAVQGKIGELVADMGSEASASGRLLESEMVRQVTAAVCAAREGGAPADAAPAPAQPAKPELAACVLRDDDLEPREVLGQLVSYVNGAGGRDMDPDEVANVMICLTQGYVTTLAGMPGTGKTSLANVMAAALGLKNARAPRFVEVPVERGWTSYKDFVGYFNPLTHTVEKANAEVFDAFAALTAEADAELSASEVAPFLFLLDEANLSSVEHYWSPFLRACDSFDQGPCRLALGGDHAFRVPGHVRFVATVNFDHTTEELSPRFLDRSWVIMLEAQPLDTEVAPAPSPAAALDVPAFSQAALERAFGPQPGTLLEPELRAKLREVADVCARNHRPVSPRSQNMMAGYARAAAGLMDRSSARTALAPVDFAVAQKVLPQLSGTEESLHALLGELRDVEGLPRTRERVERMLETGEASGYYQFFA